MNATNVKLQSKAVQTASDKTVREATLKLVLNMLANLIGLPVNMLPEVHLRRVKKSERSALSFGVDYRDDGRHQAWISEEADLPLGSRMLATIALMVKAGATTNKRGELVFAKRGYKDDMKRVGFSGKPTLVEFGDRSRDIIAYLDALVSQRGEYHVTVDRPANARSGENMVACTINGDKFRAMPASIAKLIESIARGEMPVVVYDDDKTANKALLDKATKRDKLRKTTAPRKAKRTSKAPSKAPIIVDVPNVDTANAENTQAA